MKTFFEKNKIEFYSLIPLSECKIYKQYLLDKNGFTARDNAIVFLIPYRSEKLPDNLSVYASVKDYHRYIDLFSKEAEKYIKDKFPNAKFKIFSDHSPIDEVHACCLSGLGFVGDNGLLINKKYSSFVFLAECVTNLTDKELDIPFSKCNYIDECLHCHKCETACPSHCIGKQGAVKQTDCLSALTQKKGAFTEEEKRFVLENGSLWGCDVCQNVCPFTVNAGFTPIDFFKEDVITHLDANVFEKMSDEELLSRPFMWRGKETIIRNINLFEKK